MNKMNIHYPQIGIKYSIINDVVIKESSFFAIVK